MKKNLDKMSVQDILLRDIAKLKRDLNKASMKLPPGLAGIYGEIIYGEIADSAWGKFLGNHAVVYVPSVDKSFLYSHGNRSSCAWSNKGWGVE